MMQEWHESTLIIDLIIISYAKRQIMIHKADISRFRVNRVRLSHSGMFKVFKTVTGGNPQICSTAES